MNPWLLNWEHGVLATGLPGRPRPYIFNMEVRFRVRKKWHSWLRNSCYSSVQSLSCVKLFATPWTATRQSSLFICSSRSLLKFMSIELVMPSNHLILCRPLHTPSTFPSIRVFSNESALCIRWPEYWSFSFSISPSNEYSGLMSFWMDWLGILVVQGTLKSLLQHHKGGFSVIRRILQKCSVEHNLVDRSCPHWRYLGVNLQVISGWFPPHPVSLMLVQVPRASCLTPVKNSGSDVSFTADTLMHAWPS